MTVSLRGPDGAGDELSSASLLTVVSSGLVGVVGGGAGGSGVGAAVVAYCGTSMGTSMGEMSGAVAGESEESAPANDATMLDMVEEA